MTTDIRTIAKIAEWAVGEDTGSSSKFLAACALGAAEDRYPDHPLDPDDFGRCYRFMQLLTPDEQLAALEVAAARSAKWASIGVHWHELSDLFRECFTQGHATRPRSDLYKRMKELGL